MASFTYQSKHSTARIHWRFRGKQFSKIEKVDNERHAERLAAAIEETISEIEKGRLIIPPEADLKTFILTNGRLSKPQGDAENTVRSPTLADVFDTYFATLTAGSKAASSMQTAKVHSRHFQRILGDRLKSEELTLAVVQRYADTRSNEGVVRNTIKQELTTLLVVWRWAHKRKYVASPPAWTLKDVTLPKGDERPPFATWAAIERRIERENLSPKEQDAAWETLWLTTNQTMECLDWVKTRAPHPFIYPMFVFAAYTGARRGELLRSRHEDWDFDGGFVRIRQQKADRSRVFTFREVAIHPDLAETMKTWFGSMTNPTYAISRWDRMLRANQATKWFRATLEPGKWSVLRGWHVFRHSLASNMAAAGIDQRLIDATLGHTTAAMSRRYRHLLPSKQTDAIRTLFG